MKWILSLLGFSPKSQSNLCSCGSKRITKSADVIVWGTVVTLTNSPQCKNCTETFLNKWATRCDKCGNPICTGEAVATGKHPGTYIHLNLCCTPVPDQILGHWGEGKLVPYEYRK